MHQLANDFIANIKKALNLFSRNSCSSMYYIQMVSDLAKNETISWNKCIRHQVNSHHERIMISPSTVNTEQ